MSELWTAIWGLEFRVVPVGFAMLLVIIPTMIRQRTKFYYVPIYFPFVPLRELNADLATYLGEDYWLGLDGEASDEDQLRRKILLSSIVSVAFAAVLIPAFAGFGSAFFLEAQLLPQLLGVFVLYMVWKMSLAVLHFSHHAVASRRNRILLGIVYFFYIGVAAQMLATSYGWARPYIIQNDWSGLALALTDLIFSTVLLQFLLLAALTAVVVSIFMDRRIRRANLEEYRRRYGNGP